MSAFGGTAVIVPSGAPNASVANDPKRKSSIRFCCDAQRLLFDVVGLPIPVGEGVL
jgi:hypothetical protein